MASSNTMLSQRKFIIKKKKQLEFLVYLYLNEVALCVGILVRAVYVGKSDLLIHETGRKLVTGQTRSP